MLEQLQRIKPQLRLRDFEGATEDGARFVLHEEQRTVGVALGDFLEKAEERDGCEEEAGGVCRQWRLGKGRRRVTKLVDFGFEWWGGWLGFRR